MPLLRDGPLLADLVAADGVPRQAEADDGSVHMLYRDGAVVRSCRIQDWPQAQVELAQHEQERADAAALRTRVLSLAQGAVGTRADELTAVQLRALYAIVLWKEGALDKNGIVQPLAAWVKE